MAPPRRKAPHLPDKARLHVRAWREARGLTQEELAQDIGYSVNTLARLERGEQGYSPEMLALLSDALLCSVADLFTPFAPGTPARALLDSLEKIEPEDRPKARAMLEAMASFRRTGS